MILHLNVLFHSTDKELFARAKSLLKECRPKAIDMYKRAGFGLDLTMLFEEGSQVPDAEVSLWPERGQTDAKNYYFGSTVMPFDCATFGHELSHLFGLPDEYHMEDGEGRPNFYSDEHDPKPIMTCGNRLEDLELYPRNVGQIIRQAFLPTYKVTFNPEKIKTLPGFRHYDAKTVGGKFSLVGSDSSPGTTVRLVAPKISNEFEIQGFPFADIGQDGPYTFSESGGYKLVLSNPTDPTLSVTITGTSFFDLATSAANLSKLGVQITSVVGPTPRIARDELTVYEQYEIWGTRPSDKKK